MPIVSAHFRSPSSTAHEYVRILNLRVANSRSMVHRGLLSPCISGVGSGSRATCPLPTLTELAVQCTLAVLVAHVYVHVVKRRTFAPDTCPPSRNKAVINCRLRPRCCHLGSYFKRPKSSPVRPFACNWYYCAQFIAKPKAARALRFSWSATSSILGLWANMMSSIKPEVHNVSLRRQKRTEPRPYVTCTKNLVKIGSVVPKI